MGSVYKVDGCDFEASDRLGHLQEQAAVRSFEAGHAYNQVHPLRTQLQQADHIVHTKQHTGTSGQGEESPGARERPVQQSHASACPLDFMTCLERRAS